uniref:Oxygen-dependent protoporphyrinogen oxidase n=1 Tax=Candidatus Kentrum eta TaxID=2126337 RepID=A0A450V6D7_9GAMM|nr:MAG: oxygen-dependent protoporphyrinogen oxidase [Candidatus Kentron sp. H]VFK00372.1 MAG: oxygen-dependent protoporphyrinogen oxidase [Candidatus Kentron sp. H]VFK04468.1 MAG: oxygen-dependent protoporphyrinogen oxidase [Candidatus Kentron sp. H]
MPNQGVDTSSETPQTYQAAIIGGGISGLATAFFIKRHSPGSRVAIFEKETRLGGTMQTAHRDGFLFEAGPNGFLSNREQTLDLVRDSGAEALLLRSEDAARIRYVFTDGLHKLPDSPPAFLRTGLLSARDKLRVLGEVFIPPKKDDEDESLRAFGYRRVGCRFTDVFLDALSAGIHASTPDRLSVNAAFPAVVELEKDYGGLFRGMIRKRRKEAGPGGVLMSFRGGVSAFVEHLAEHLTTTLPVEFHTGAPVTRLTRRDAGYRLTARAAGRETEFEAESVILATPSYVSAELMDPLDRALANRLRAIAYPPVAVVGFGYKDLAYPLNGFGLLTTTGARERILGVLWDSAIFPGRAPDGQKSVRVLIGGQRNPELALGDESGLIDIARAGIRNTMGVDDAPSTVFIKRWERGIPNYSVGHLANVRAIHERIATYPGLYLNSNAYFGIGINDCVINSLGLARRWVEGCP